MPSAYLADTLLVDAAKEAGMLPRAGETSLSARLYGILNREQRLYLTALVKRARDGYLDDSATLTVVAGTTRYRLPTRAVASAVTLVEWVDGSSTRLLHPLSHKTAAESGAGTGVGDYYFDGNYLVLVSTPSAGASLRVTYARRRNKVVAATETREVTAINTGTKVVTLASAIPATFTTSVTYDFIRGTPHFDVLGKDLAVTTAYATDLTFTETLPTELAVGDYVALAGETPIANVPMELQDVLVLRTVYMALGGNANPNAAFFREVLEQAEADVLTLLTPRASDTPEAIINRHGPGFNRLRSWNRYRGGY